MARARTRPTRQDTIDQLIDGARRAFVDRGFYGASIEDICASAGLTRGAFYSAFGRKEDLFLVLYDRMISEVGALFIAGLDRAARSDLDPVEALFESLTEHFPIGRDWYVLNAEFTLFAVRDADAARALAARRHALRLVIADKLDLALARTRHRATVSTELLARAVIALAADGLGQSLIEPDALGATTLLRSFMAPLVRSLAVPDDAATTGHEPAGDSDDRPAASGADCRDSIDAGADYRDRVEAGADGDVGRRLLSAAQTAFLRDGYGKTRLSDIAAMAEISKKTIYAHAPSKSALFAAVVRAAIGDAAGDEPLGADGDRDLADTLHAYLTRYAQRCFSNVGVAVYGLVVSEAKQFPDLVQAYLDAARNGACAELAALLRAKSDRGMRMVGSPESAASMLIEMVVAEPLRLAALGIAPPPGQAEIERRVGEAVTVFLNGAGEVPPSPRASNGTILAGREPNGFHAGTTPDRSLDR